VSVCVCVCVCERERERERERVRDRSRIIILGLRVDAREGSRRGRDPDDRLGWIVIGREFNPLPFAPPWSGVHV